MRIVTSLAFLLGVIGAGCATSVDATPARPNGAALARATLEEVRSKPAFAKLGVAASPSVLPVTLPPRSRAPMRVAHQGVTLDLSSDVPDVETTLEGGAAIARVSPSVDVLFGASGDRAEEVRVLRDAAAPRALRWTLHVSGATAEREGERVELVDGNGVPRLAIEPMFVVDARGERRDLATALARIDEHTWSIEANLDATGLSFPVYVDPVVTPWTGAEPMSVPRIGHTATLLADNTVLVVGGASSEGGAALSSAEIYDVATNAWTTVGSMSDARVHHTATRLADGKVLVIGGTKKHGSVPALSTAEIYDPSTKTWTKTSPLPTERSWHGAALLSDGHVLVAGGSRAIDGNPVDFSLPPLTFDPATKTFTPMTSYGVNVPTASVSVPVGSDSILYAGGLLPTSCAGPTACIAEPATDVVVYDGATKKFSKVGSLRRKRAFGFDEPLVAAAKFGTGVLVIGGADDSGEVWSKDTGAWATSLGGELSDPWSAPTMVTTPAGDAVAIGGFVASPGFPFTPIKLFATSLVRHHATGRWADGTPPVRRRWSYTATVLGDGSVLVAGGQNKDSALQVAEIWKAFDLGHDCTLGGDCASAFCVDGVCCESQCGDQCEACNKDGKCVPVTGAPRGLRPLCVDPGGDVCKAQVCNGTDTAKCNLPKGNRCAAAACSGSTFSPESTCDGAGGCTKPAPVECKPFGCTEAGCRTSCSTASDCANGFVCASGTCIEQKGTTCKPDLSAQVSTASGTETACSPYLCKPSTGGCGDTCNASSDCAGGFVCNANRCEAAPTGGDSGSSGCTMSHGASATSVALFLMALSFVARRRR